jgi:hypothetical protein
MVDQQRERVAGVQASRCFCAWVKKKFSREIATDAPPPRQLLLLRCPSTRGSRAHPGYRRARGDPVLAWFPSDPLAPLSFRVAPLCSNWCARCWEWGWPRRSAHIHRSHTSGSPTRRWNPPCGAGTRGTSSPMASLPSQWHRCPALATPSPSGAPPFLASTSSEEVEKMLNLATASSVQLCYASSCTHSSLHVPFCFYIPSNSRHYRLQFQGADPIDDDCNLFDEMATRAEV